MSSILPPGAWTLLPSVPVLPEQELTPTTKLRPLAEVLDMALAEQEAERGNLQRRAHDTYLKMKPAIDELIAWLQARLGLKVEMTLHVDPNSHNGCHTVRLAWGDAHHAPGMPGMRYDGMNFTADGAWTDNGEDISTHEKFWEWARKRVSWWLPSKAPAATVPETKSAPRRRRIGR